jgi:hypothetical protein
VKHLLDYLILLAGSVIAGIVLMRVCGECCSWLADNHQPQLYSVAHSACFAPTEFLNLAQGRPKHAHPPNEWWVPILHWTMIVFGCSLAMWRWLAKRKR